MGVARRRLLGGALVAAGGAVVGGAATALWPLLGPDRLPISGGYAPAGVARTWSPRGQVQVHWHVPTDEPLVALTFDDGPGPWTPMVLDALDRADAPATFFMVGERLTRAPELVRGRLDRHEVGNHTWAHRDLAQLDEAGVRDQLTRTHDAIHRLLGRSPTLMRPPWGHLGGSTLTVVDELGYDVVMWSQQMRETMFQADPPAQVRDIVDNAKPGTIVLAHDVGGPDRLVALRQIGAFIDGFRARGLKPVTVSELLAARRSGPPGPSPAGR
ncbi:polysaccharide deacetylase family protein [Micromonospora zhanjiangensis]|uniref:Polysaccharide deacetylase family protein n=1 Tax=Micromonospora zhanjiangensis TaxID=1522057 RepID=A0ABV8KIT2_9ACTN